MGAGYMSVGTYTGGFPAGRPSATSSLPLIARLRPNCMFDCPEHTQTSPTRTFLSVRVFLPAMVISSGPPRLERADLDHPLAVGAGGGRRLCLTDRHRYLLTRGGSAPHGNGLAPLQDAVSVNMVETVTLAAAGQAASINKADAIPIRALTPIRSICYPFNAGNT